MPSKEAGVQSSLVRNNKKVAQSIWGKLSPISAHALEDLATRFRFSVASGDLLLLYGSWYITHSALLRLASRRHCSSINASPLRHFCDSAANRWAFRATVYKSRSCRGFVGYGDADPSNVSPLVRGAEMRVAETRAVNRALRKAYGIGICSIEEIGGLDGARVEPRSRKIP